MEYELLLASDAAELSALVNAKLKQGWQLYGDTIVNSNTYTDENGVDQIDLTCCQAVILENTGYVENTSYV
jgi:hypothetical protein